MQMPGIGHPKRQKMASLAMSCAELRRKDQPHLRDQVLPVLEKLKEVADRAKDDATSWVELALLAITFARSVSQNQSARAQPKQPSTRIYTNVEVGAELRGGTTRGAKEGNNPRINNKTYSNSRGKQQNQTQ
ncbi:uncharacterized protein J3R85_018159 [Psidium guajava]|nr:uncharacterized protein J3R85_018159 [Psidium guajava]